MKKVMRVSNVPVNWPDPPASDFLPKPRTPHDLLAHWEWWLYSQYQNEDASTFWKMHSQVMWQRLSACPKLVRLCHTQPSRQLHELLMLLYRFYDLVEKGRMDNKNLSPPAPGMFGFPHPKDDQAKDVKRAQKAAIKLNRARTLIADARDFLHPDEWNTVEQFLAHGLMRAVNQAGPGPDGIVFKLKNRENPGLGPVTITLPRQPDTRKRTEPGQPFGTGGDLNMFLAVLGDLLNEILHGRGHWEIGISILDAFHPPQFQKNNTPWGADTLRLTVYQFMHPIGKDEDDTKKKREAVKNKLMSLRAWLTRIVDDAQRYPTVVCPLPDFLLHMPSSSVAD